MADVLVNRPDIAKQREASQNAAFGLAPAGIIERAQAFGAKSMPIYIYNVGPIEFKEPRYPNHPHILIKRCPVDKEWILVSSLQHPFEEKRFDGNGNPFTVFTDGFLEATRTLNPMNPGFDQSWGCDPDQEINPGSNWCALGVFWSVNYPPDQYEVDDCRKRMEKTFKKELETMVGEEAKSPEAARARANDISHAAANYFGQSFSWHRSDLTRKSADAGKVDCSVCGEKIQPKALLCVHCSAPTDPERQEAWLAKRFQGAK